MRISPEVEIALSLAANEAARRRHEYVTLEHLLYALLFDEQTAQVVRHAGGDPNAIKKELEQFLSDVHWGELDTVVIDMPPGTGDMAISLGQLLPRAEVLVVTTPQPLAQEVAARAAMMAKKTGQKLLGVVENMAMHVCSNCGHVEHIFGEGGGLRYAQEKGVDYLGALPLDIRIRENSDNGQPTVVADADGEIAGIYRSVARQVAVKIAAKAKDFSSKFPTITVSKNT